MGTKRVRIIRINGDIMDDDKDICVNCMRCFDSDDPEIIPDEIRYNICKCCEKKKLYGEIEIYLVCRNKKPSLFHRIWRRFNKIKKT